MAKKLIEVNGKLVLQRDVPTSPNRLGPTKVKEALNKTAQNKKAAQSSGSVPYASPLASRKTPIDTSPRNYGRPLTNKLHLGLYDDEKSLSNVTLGDVTYKPLLSGYYGQKMNEAIGVNRLAGNTNMNTPQIAKYQGLAQKFEPTRFSNPNAPFGGLLNNAPQGAMSLIGQQVANLTDEDTVMYAGTGAAAGAMIGSVAGLPGSAISAASGLKAGIAAGVGKNMFEAVYGGTYRDLMDAGVSDSTAHKTALISAGVQSALEMAQLDELAKAAKLLRKQNKAVLAEGIEKILIDRGKGVLKNTAEEVAQEGVAMGFEYDAKKLEGLPTDSWQDNVNRAVETGLNSALSIGLISLPGAVSARRQINSYNGKLNSMDKAVGIANKIKRESDIKNPEFTGPFMQPQTAEPQIAQFTPDENVKNVLASKFKSTEDVKKWAENLAQKSKFDIEFIADADASYNGYFKPYAPGESNGKQGKMVVNLHSEDPIKTVFGHELTHILEANSKEYNEYANFAINNLVNRHYGTADITALAEQKAASYAQRGVNLSIDEAKQEIVAELSGEYLFKDEQSITDLYRYNENLFYRIYENIKNMIKSFAGTDEEKDLIKARNLYAKVLKANQKNPGVVQTAQEGDTQVAASYLFAGERATNADKEALAKAQQMEADNADAETIWKETGWFRGPDKKWRWEIDDSQAEFRTDEQKRDIVTKASSELMDKKIKLENFEREMERAARRYVEENDVDPEIIDWDNPVSDLISYAKADRLKPLYAEYESLLDDYQKTRKLAEGNPVEGQFAHDDIYENYPSLGNMSLNKQDLGPMMKGQYNPLLDTATINAALSEDEGKSTLLHEMQHKIQRTEGFAKGASLEKEEAKIKEVFSDIKSMEDNIRMFKKQIGFEEYAKSQVKRFTSKEITYDEMKKNIDAFVANSKYAKEINGNQAVLDEYIEKNRPYMSRDAYNVYQNHAGEIEAREVQNRQNMTAQERREKLPDLGGDEAIVKFSLKSDEKGSYVNVDTDQDIFEGASRKNVPKVAQDYMNKRFKNEILDGVKVDSKGINKMTHPGNSQPLFVQKMRAMTELDNIIKASVFVDSEKATKDSAKYPEYEYYGFNFKLSGQWFNGILNIGLDGDGQRHLYEINKIYHGRRPYEGFTLQERIEATMADSINNNIPTNEQDVNIETEKKYSDEDGTKFSLKKADAKHIARKIKADYGSKSTIKDISQELTEIYDMDVNDMMAVNQRIEDLAAKIAENVPTVNEFEQRIKEFRQAVRNMPIRVDDNIKADIADFNAWSKRYFNRLNLSADGRNIDELYGSLAEQFPEFLESDIDNPTDQLMSIAEALDTTRQDKGYSNNEDMMYDILLDIYDDYYRYQADEQAKAAEGPETEPGDDGPGNNGPTDDGDAYGDYDGDTSLARIDVWEHTEPEDRSPYFEKGENPARDINVPQRDEYGRKVSRFTRTAAESRALDDNQASELNESVWNGTFSYNVITDQDAINRANDKMERFDNDTLLNGLESKLYDSKIITKDDIALGERLIQEYAKEKDTENLERAIAVVATAGTRAGQAVQAMRLLKKLSPAGQLMALQKQIDTINTDMKLLGDNKVTLSPERAKDITSSDTPEGLEQAVERAKMELYNKVPSRWVDKWNAWRYLSMLGNPKTHIRNVLGNAIFVPVRGMKNVIGATIEAATVKGERSKAIGKLPKVFKEFAAKEFDVNREVIDAGGKENIMKDRKIYTSKWFAWLEALRKLNSDVLEAEDRFFIKSAYVKSFAGYLKANKISPALVQKLMSGKGTDIEIGDAATAKIFNNARAYAMNEAQKATYRDYSALANALNKFKKTNAVTAVLGEGLMPFTKTPINILKRGVEYSPAGILKGIKELANDVRKADDDKKQQTILKGIDSMASGLSGTAILALGAFLASQGILSGGGEEDKKERDMAAMMGSQNYSFNIGDVSYTVDWMAPVSLPLFVGVELFNSLESGTVNGFVDIADSMTSISEPMVNMSMLQGLNRAVTNFDQKDALTSTATDMALGYFSQGVPTLSGQFARTMDATRRTAYVDKNNDIPDTLERPMLNAAAKVPGLSKKLNPYRDSFGRPQTNDSALMRAFENFISPGYVKVKKNDMVLSELQKVYGRTGEKGVLPSLPNKKIGERDLTAKEYDRMAYIKGKQSYDLINTMRRSDAYKDLSAADQAKMISDAYSYAYAMAKDDALGVKPDGWIAKAAEAEKKHDIPVETYITYNNYKNSLKGDGTKAKFIDKIQSDESLTQKQKDKLDDYWYGSIEASKITELSNAEQRQWNVAKEYGFDEEKFSKYVGYITQQGEGKTKMNNINDAVKAGLPRGEAVLLYNIMRQKKYRYNG